LRKPAAILLLSLAELLAMAVWFSASAVVPILAKVWQLGESGQAWLTMSVQAGFAAGTLISAVFNLADRWSARPLFAGSACFAALCTASIPAAGSAGAFPLRFLTGLFLAGVYPVGMKIMATWTREDRGFGIGLLVGALTLGSAAPHLLRALSPSSDWRAVLYGSAVLGLAGGALAAALVREGPYGTAAPPFRWQYGWELLRRRDVVLANLGYLGHMWELYAVWAWMPVFLLASFRAHGDPGWARAAPVVAIGSGAAGCLLAGKLADRIGRTAVTIASLAVSGGCCLAAGWFYGGNPLPLVALCTLWGFAVVADSAQYSAAVTELCLAEYTGTALTLQTCLGFILTLATIRIIPSLVALLGWKWAFSFLAIGPAAGIIAMAALRRLPEAGRMAGGNR
jgi:MFS family permease